MAMPVISVEVAFGDNWNVASPTWTAITTYVRPPFSITRGRDDPFTAVRPGRLVLNLDNRDGRFDPENTAGPYYGNLQPITPIRMRATHNAVTYDLFRGFVSEWPGAQQVDFKDSIVTVEALDGLSMLNLFVSSSIWKSEVSKHQPFLWWRMGETSGTTANNSAGEGFDGTYNNTPTLGNAGGPIVAGGTGYYVAFNGAQSEFVQANGIRGAGGAWSAGGWFRVAASTAAVLWSFDHGAPFGYPWDEYHGVVHIDAANGFISAHLYGSPSDDPITIQGSADLGDGAWHFWTLTHDGTDTAKLYVDGASVGTDTSTNAWVFLNTYLFRLHVGTDRDGSGYYYGTQDSAETFMTLTEMTATQISDAYNAAVSGWGQQLTSARVTNILDTMGWAAADRSIETGNTTMVAFDQTASAKVAIQQVDDTEDGLFFVGKDGKATWHSRYHRSKAGVSAIYSNDGSDTPYVDLVWSVDDRYLRTKTIVTDPNGETYETSGSGLTRYGPRVLQRTSKAVDVASAANLSNALTARFGTPRARIPHLNVRLGGGSPNAQWAELLSRDLNDRITVEVKPIGQTTQRSYDMVVEQIAIHGTLEVWDQTIVCSNAAGFAFFTLNDTIYGQLNGVGILGW